MSGLCRRFDFQCYELNQRTRVARVRSLCLSRIRSAQESSYHQNGKEKNPYRHREQDLVAGRLARLGLDLMHVPTPPIA